MRSVIMYLFLHYCTINELMITYHGSQSCNYLRRLMIFDMG